MLTREETSEIVKTISESKNLLRFQERMLANATAAGDRAKAANARKRIAELRQKIRAGTGRLQEARNSAIPHFRAREKRIAPVTNWR